MTPEVYRQAASVLVLRSVDDRLEILLLHKPRKRDAWQLPQGGMEEGETVEQAALRELHEEAGLRGCRVLGQSERVYGYEFPAGFRRFRPDNVRGQRVRFILAVLPDGAEVAIDRKEIDDHRWVTLGELRKYVRRAEYVEIVEGLYEEARRRMERGE